MFYLHRLPMRVTRVSVCCAESEAVCQLHLVCEVKFLGPLSRSIRNIERRLFTKIITQIDHKLRDESLKSN
jgi:hypothetical protein